MAEPNEPFSAEDVERQIERMSQFKEDDRRDAEAMAYLHSFYQTDAKHEQERLDRIWNRIADTALFKQNNQANEKEPSMQNPSQPLQTPYSAGSMANSRGRRSQRSPLMRRLSILAATVFLIALLASITIVFYAVRQTNGGNASPNPPLAIPTPHSQFTVLSVNMSVTPGSIANVACGTNLIVTYTATFHVKPNSPGGTIKFYYTVNNGRGQTPASLTFSPGQTSKSYSFTWSGALFADHAYPEPGGVQVTSPNQLTSSLIAPTGQCKTAAPFKVTQIAMVVNPTSSQGLACGSSIVVTYTATIHVAPNSSGGTVQFYYTVNNGRGQTPASLTFSPGQTSKSYSFTWSGALPIDHTYPEPGGVQVTSPNQLTSPLVAPTGQCTTAAQLQVTQIVMALSPASIQGRVCGSSIVVTYTATIYVIPNSSGGTVQFYYTVNNGRGQTPASLTFSPGQTSKSYSFTWSGALPADHTYPGQGGVEVTSPNQLTSSLIAPTGQCS